MYGSTARGKPAKGIRNRRSSTGRSRVSRSARNAVAARPTTVVLHCRRARFVPPPPRVVGAFVKGHRGHKWTAGTAMVGVVAKGDGLLRTLKSELELPAPTRPERSLEGVKEATGWSRMSRPQAKPAGSAPACQSSTRAVMVGETVIGFGRVTPGASLTPMTREDFLVIIPIDGFCELHMPGRKVRCGAGDGVILSHQRDVRIEWPVAGSNRFVEVPYHRMRSELESLLCQPVGQPIEFDLILDLLGPKKRLWTEVVDLIECAGAESCLTSHPLTARNLERVLIQGLLTSQRHTLSACLQPNQSRVCQGLIEATAELVRSNPAHRWTVGELANELAVSVRSLQHEFQISIGVPPSRYVRDLRLEWIRTDLIAAGPRETTVSRLAAKWGFTDLGRFAQAYRERFQENPSDSLRRLNRGGMVKSCGWRVLS